MDAFPLLPIDEALQVVHNCNVFTSFNLAQRYLQLAMAEDDIKKTALRTGSSGLYKFTCMPFGLSNAGSSFCRLMEQCLGDQQFVTLLLYLDDIYSFAPDVSAMLDQIKLVFSWLKAFNLEIKPKKLQQVDFLWNRIVVELKTSFHPLLWTSSGLRDSSKTAPYMENGRFTEHAHNLWGVKSVT